jgi:hypothetical protein
LGLSRESFIGTVVITEAKASRTSNELPLGIWLKLDVRGVRLEKNKCVLMLMTRLADVIY